MGGKGVVPSGGKTLCRRDWGSAPSQTISVPQPNDRQIGAGIPKVHWRTE